MTHKFIDQYGNKVKHNRLETTEQYLTEKYIGENDIVLELGARYGTVSKVINNKLMNKKNHVAVEPDDRVWSALERNRDFNNCEFFIVKGFISKQKFSLTNMDNYYRGYGSTAIQNTDSHIPSYTLNEIKNKYELKFNTLVADCEGFLEIFFDENPELYQQLHLIIFETDYEAKCDYNKIRNNLKLNGFNQIETCRGNEVWKKFEC
jgi:FkbM family methyltransferase